MKINTIFLFICCLGAFACIESNLYMVALFAAYPLYVSLMKIKKDIETQRSFIIEKKLYK